MGSIAIILGAGVTKGSGYKLNLKCSDNENSIPADKDFLEKVFKNDIHKKCWEELPQASKNKKTIKLLYNSFISLMKEFKIIENDNDNKISELGLALGLEEIWNTVVLNTKFVQQDLVRFDVHRLEESWDRTQTESPQVKIIKRSDYFLRVLIQKVYGEMIDYEEARNANNSFKTMFKVLGLEKYKKTKDKISFLTFNYDLCLENSLWACMDNHQYFYYPSFDNNHIAKEYVLFPIYKLHGSLNWWHGYDGFIRLIKKGAEILEPISITEVAYFRERDFDSWEKYQPSIIPADFLKEEFFNEEGQRRLHRHYMKLWAGAGKALQESDAIIIIGYSFPSADPHARWLMRASQCNLFSEKYKFKPKPVFSITSCDKDKEETINTLKTLFNLKLTVCTKGFENCFEDLKKWLKVNLYK